MKTLSLLSLVFVVGCASAPSPVAENRPGALGNALQVIAASNRNLELEPCGCSMAPLGGLQRERNLLEKTLIPAGASRFFFSTGTTFVPGPTHFSAQQTEHYRLKAGFLAKAMDLLHVTAVAPTANDLALGADTLRQIEKTAHFKLVTTNLWDKNRGGPVFTPRLDYQFDGATVYVFGLSSPRDAAYPADDRYEVRPAREVMRTELARLPKEGKRAVLVLSALGEKDREALLEEFPEITLLVGGARGESTWNASVSHFSTVYGVPTDMARSLLLVELELRGDYRKFVSPYYETERDKRVARITADLKKKPAKAKELEEELKQLQGTPRSEDPAVNRYGSKMVVLGPEWDEPKNELTKLVDEYKEKVRGLAVSESDD